MATKPKTLATRTRRAVHSTLRKLFAFLPRAARFHLYRSFVDCDPAPDVRLVLKIADSKEELEACFKLLHDAYVASGFMKPHPSGMRVTLYHALPTTTTLCAKFDGRVVGTISLIRQGPFGFPLQSVFDLSSVEAERGKIAEVSALAVHPDFRKTGGKILFPLMKFMYEYCSTYFDTRHLVIAVNPYHIELYESLLFFQRLPQKKVDQYDFANGAPAVGAALNLHTVRDVLKKHYSGKDRRKDLHHYFLRLKLPNIVQPARRYFTTNDPVMTPELLDYFFNQRTDQFAPLDDRKKLILHTVYDLPDYRAVLPALQVPLADQSALRRHPRFSLKCKASFQFASGGTTQTAALQVIDISAEGFQAHARLPLSVQASGEAQIQLGSNDLATVRAVVMRGKRYDDFGLYGFKLLESDRVWQKCVAALQSSKTYHELQQASMFIPREETVSLG